MVVWKWRISGSETNMLSGCTRLNTAYMVMRVTANRLSSSIYQTDSKKRLSKNRIRTVGCVSQLLPLSRQQLVSEEEVARDANSTY